MMTPSDVERVVDNRKLKRSVFLWRSLTIAVVLAGLAALLWSMGDLQKQQSHIARVKIEGMITGDRATLDSLQAIADSSSVAALILEIDSPGGTTAGSEAVYEALRKIARDKPIVAVMDTVAASGGYITAIAADHIVARGNTITGSIGVIFSFPEVSRLLDMIGVKMEEIKSGELKAEPSPYKPVSDKARAVANEMIKDSFDWFVGLVAERRQMPLPRATFLADGRVYTGRQALKEKLIDAIGGEDVALAWLHDTKKISADLPILDWSPAAGVGRSGLGFSIARSVLGVFGLEGLAPSAEKAKLDGLLVLWHPLQ